jgi:hypothetical protein
LGLSSCYGVGGVFLHLTVPGAANTVIALAVMIATVSGTGLVKAIKLQLFLVILSIVSELVKVLKSVSIVRIAHFPS